MRQGTCSHRPPPQQWEGLGKPRRAAGEGGGGGKCLVSTADICPVSTADISISIHHSASAFRINNHHIMEAATAADLTQASEIAGRYITLGSAARASRPVPGLVLEVQVPPKMSVRAQLIKNDPNRIQNSRFGLNINPGTPLQRVSDRSHSKKRKKRLAEPPQDKCKSKLRRPREEHGEAWP